MYNHVWDKLFKQRNYNRYNEDKEITIKELLIKKLQTRKLTNKGDRRLAMPPVSGDDGGGRAGEIKQRGVEKREPWGVL